MSMIEVKGLRKSFGELEVLKGIDQNVEEGEVLCIVGPSGSGKSTMLRCINRLEEPTGGEIYIDGELITEKNLDRIRTKMGMVFQQFNLFPHMSVLDNLTCGPINVKGVDKGQMEAARSLGMSRGMAMRLIIIPQAIRIILPAFANEFVTLIKETSVLGYVGVVEILRRGQLWNASSFETFPAYIGVALAYMLLTIPLSKAINGYERKRARKEAAA